LPPPTPPHDSDDDDKPKPPRPDVGARPKPLLTKQDGVKDLSLLTGKKKDKDDLGLVQTHDREKEEGEETGEDTGETTGEETGEGEQNQEEESEFLQTRDKPKPNDDVVISFENDDPLPLQNQQAWLITNQFELQDASKKIHGY